MKFNLKNLFLFSIFLVNSNFFASEIAMSALVNSDFFASEIAISAEEKEQRINQAIKDYESQFLNKFAKAKPEDEKKISKELHDELIEKLKSLGLRDEEFMQAWWKAQELICYGPNADQDSKGMIQLTRRQYEHFVHSAPQNKYHKPPKSLSEIEEERKKRREKAEKDREKTRAVREAEKKWLEEQAAREAEKFRALEKSAAKVQKKAENKKKKEKQIAKKAILGQLALVEVIKAKYAADLKFNAKTLVHCAVKYNDLDALKVLVKLNYNVNEKDSGGRTALHYAAYICPTEKLEIRHQILEFLIKDCAANINTTSKVGWTPLHVAACCGNFVAVKLLLENGADKKLLTKHERQSAAEIALTYNNREIAQFIKNY